MHSHLLGFTRALVEAQTPREKILCALQTLRGEISFDTDILWAFTEFCLRHQRLEGMCLQDAINAISGYGFEANWDSEKPARRFLEYVGVLLTDDHVQNLRLFYSMYAFLSLKRQYPELPARESLEIILSKTLRQGIQQTHRGYSSRSSALR